MTASRICACGFYLHEFGHGRRLQCRGAADENDLRAASDGGFGQGISHLAAGTVADEAHRIDRLVGWSGGDENGLAFQVLLDAQHGERGFDDLFGFGETSGADHAAREISAAGFDDVHSALAQRFEILLRRFVLPHVDVHGGSDDDVEPWSQDKWWRGSRWRFRWRIWRACPPCRARRAGRLPIVRR